MLHVVKMSRPASARVLLCAIVLMEFIMFIDCGPVNNSSVCIRNNIPFNDSETPSMPCCPNWMYDKITKSCVADCESDCINGKCIEPNVCGCNDGYIKNPEDEFVCLPKCDKPCENGICTGPNDCSCHDRYEKDPKNIFVCVPKCEPKCVNSSCTSFNSCTCYPGFEKTEKSNICRSQCDQPCENAICSGPNTCRCNDGYEADPKNIFACVPKCDPKCINGTCTSFNNCECNVDHVKTEKSNVCKPYCKLECIHGTCTSPNVCSCDDGYVKNESDLNVCYKPCEKLCLDGTCSVDGHCPLVKSVECYVCNVTCPQENDTCLCADGTPCHNILEIPAEVSRPWAAKLDVIVIAPAVVALLLIILIVIVIQRIGHRRQKKTLSDTENIPNIGSVEYHTFPATLLQQKRYDYAYDDPNIEMATEPETTDTLLRVHENRT